MVSGAGQARARILKPPPILKGRRSLQSSHREDASSYHSDPPMLNDAAHSAQARSSNMFLNVLLAACMFIIVAPLDIEGKISDHFLARSGIDVAMLAYVAFSLNQKLLAAYLVGMISMIFVGGRRFP